MTSCVNQYCFLIGIFKGQQNNHLKDSWSLKSSKISDIFFELVLTCARQRDTHTQNKKSHIKSLEKEDIGNEEK